MRTIWHDRTKTILACALLALLLLSLIEPPYPEFLLLQHVPTVAACILISWWDRRWPIGRGAFACLIGMLALHVVGARYIYSAVPYDTWVQVLTGFRITDALGLERNHYDRLVHLGFGLLLLRPLREHLEAYRDYPRGRACVTAVLAILAASMAYEIVEWLVAITFSPEDAEAYNGQQGDAWDAQKDMALALVGAVIAAVLQGQRPQGLAARG